MLRKKELEDGERKKELGLHNVEGRIETHTRNRMLQGQSIFIRVTVRDTHCEHVS